MTDGVMIAPSILSADFGALREAVSVVEEAGADLIHVDVMDGSFVPNLTVGPPVVSALKRCTSLPLDVHLMIANADESVGWYLDAGADMLTVHVEACTHLHRVVHAIREGGAKPGVTLNPGTPIGSLEAILPDVDYVLLMSVDPGFSGQSFIEASLGRLRELRELSAALRLAPLIEIDGGINLDTAQAAVESGARCLVAGNAVFGAPDPGAALRALREEAVRGLALTA
jgi:ribulose-phosphate 3-epimerase